MVTSKLLIQLVAVARPTAVLLTLIGKISLLSVHGKGPKLILKKNKFTIKNPKTLIFVTIDAPYIPYR